MNDTPETPRDDPETRAPEGAEPAGAAPAASETDPVEPPAGERPEDERPEGERIAKLLARAGIASRRDVERMIGEGRVRLHGELVTTPATILRDLRGVSVDGQAVRAAEAARLFVFHKPAGLLTAERDPAGRPTIYTALRNALPPGTPRVMPVGRLDLNTEGLLLLTNDGELKRKLELPATGIPRTYRARTFGDISQNRLEELIEGIEIEGVRYAGIDANMERRTGRNQWIELTLTEGKNREVRRVLEHLGLEVSRLLRIAYGPFVLADLPRGAAVEIAPAQVEKFRVELGLPPSRRAAERPPARLETRTPGGRTPTAGSAAARARPKPALARRKADPSRPDEALGRRTGAHDRSGPRERAEPRQNADLRKGPGQDRPGPRQRPERSGPGTRDERVGSRQGADPRKGSTQDRPVARTRPEHGGPAARDERPAPRDWARTNDRKPAAKRPSGRPQTERTERADQRAPRQPAAGTLTTRSPDRDRGGDRPQRPGSDRPGEKPRSAPHGRPAGKGPAGKGPPRKGPPRKGPRP